jgi:hypothetical protein
VVVHVCVDCQVACGHCKNQYDSNYARSTHSDGGGKRAHASMPPRYICKPLKNVPTTFSTATEYHCKTLGSIVHPCPGCEKNACQEFCRPWNQAAPGRCSRQWLCMFASTAKLHVGIAKTNTIQIMHYFLLGKIVLHWLDYANRNPTPLKKDEKVG